MESTKIIKKPLISIITTVKNGEKHLEECIQSVLNQSYKNIQYINDSKATNADAAKQALTIYNNIYWILGGVETVSYTHLTLPTSVPV